MTNIQDILNKISQSKFAKTGRGWGGVTSSTKKNKKVFVFNSDGKQVEILKSALCATKKYGTTIPSRLKTGIPDKQGLFFSYSNEYRPKNRTYRFPPKPVLQYKNNELIAEYSSIHEASDKLEINESNISMCAKGQRKSAGGFVFKYK